MPDTSGKRRSLTEMVRTRSSLRRKGLKVVFTNGCFDILHSGHIHLFREAKKQGDVLVVGVNDDGSIRKIKGPGRPVFPLEERLEVLEAIESIDYLVAFSEPTPRRLIRALIPDVLVKGGDWGLGQVVGRTEVEEAGGSVVLVPPKPGLSTTKLIEKIAGCRG